MIGDITTKEELLNVREEIGQKICELENQLTSLKEDVDFLIKYPKNRIIRMKQPKDINELKIPSNVKVVSITEIKEKINSFFREYGLIKTDVNHLYIARLEFNLTTEEDEKSRNQKRKSDQLQTEANETGKFLNEIDKWIDSLPDSEEVVFHPDDGGMTQIDPPSLQLDAGPADTNLQSVVDDLEGIVVLC